MTEAHDPLDAPRTPRSPLRDDEPDAPVNPGEPARDPGPEVERVTKRDHPGTGHVTPQPTTDRPQQDGQDEAQRALQQENAGTTMDQPSQ